MNFEDPVLLAQAKKIAESKKKKQPKVERKGQQFDSAKYELDKKKKNQEIITGDSSQEEE